MPSESSEDPILAALRARDIRIRRVRYRENRSVLLSVSSDGRTLNSHACFRDAPSTIVEAVVTVVTSGRDSRARRRALRTLREWEGTREGLTRARRTKAPRRPRVDGAEAAALRVLFRRLNRAKFGGRLPEIPLRVSGRMTRTLGTVRYGGGGVSGSSAGPGGGGRGSPVRPETPQERTVAEIAVSSDLLRPSNRALLEDTLLHEMAHAEAWLLHGHRGHGRVWKTIARRVGCRPRAVNDVRVAGRSRARR